MIYGADSWASNPENDGRLQHFGDNVKVSEYERAGSVPLSSLNVKIDYGYAVARTTYGERMWQRRIAP